MRWLFENMAIGLKIETKVKYINVQGNHPQGRAKESYEFWVRVLGGRF